MQQAADAKHAALEARAQAEGAELRSKELGKEAQCISHDRWEAFSRPPAVVLIHSSATMALSTEHKRHVLCIAAHAAHATMCYSAWPPTTTKTTA